MMIFQQGLNKQEININTREKQEDHSREFHQDMSMTEEVEPAGKIDSESKVVVSEMLATLRMSLTKKNMTKLNYQFQLKLPRRHQFKRKSNQKNPKSLLFLSITKARESILI